MVTRWKTSYSSGCREKLTSPLYTRNWLSLSTWVPHWSLVWLCFPQVSLERCKIHAYLVWQFTWLNNDWSIISILGNFSTITAKFSFERRIGYYLIQVYFPDIFVVVLSWIVFWMEKEDIGNRMALGITTILTIMFLLGSLNGNLPKVSYPKALDWYLLFSFSFVFLSLIESTVVFLFAVKANKNEKIKCKVKPGRQYSVTV